jgi:hypothetical protein
MVETRILTKRDHPIRHFFMDSRIQDDSRYPQPIFMIAIEIFGNQKIDVLKVEITPAYTGPPWLVEENEIIVLTICPIPKGASKERIKTEFTSLMADKYEEYDQIYTDGSLKDDKVGFAIVTNNQIIKKRMR